MRSYRLYQVDSFTRQKLLGNPAGVVANADGLSEAEMQQIAREMNDSETAFLLSPDDATHDVRVRFFTPQNEVPICGHATVAAHYVRAVEQKLGHVRVLQKTGAGILPVELIPDHGDYLVVMTQGAVAFGDVIAGESLSRLLSALRINPDDLAQNGPVQIVSTGHSKVMIGIRSQNRLHALQPDLETLRLLSESIGCNGYYVYTFQPDQPVPVHGRMFAPAIGIPEDPVTGNANGPLGAYLYRYGLIPVQNGEASFTAIQGEAIRRTGSMRVHVKGEGGIPLEVSITGNAVIAFSTTLTLEDEPAGCSAG